MHSTTHFLFLASVVWKGLVGVFETLSSFLLFSSGAASALLVFLTEHELGEDPQDFLANKVHEFLPSLAVSTQFFAAWYFLIHGVVNIVLSISLLRRKLWAFHAALWIHFFFILYQLYRFSHTHAFMLIALSIADAFVMWFIWKEYRYVRERWGVSNEDLGV